MAELRNNLRDALRKLSYNTSVDQLRRRGVRRVNVLGLDRVVSLVEEAVYRSLRNRLMGLDRKQVADETKAEFLRLMRTNQKLSKDREQLREVTERSGEEVVHLRQELAQQRKLLREKLERAARRRVDGAESDDSEIIARVKELFRKVFAGRDADPERMQAHLLKTVLEVVHVERQSAIEAREELHNREVDLLQRRIAKVNQALGDTERQLSETVRGGATADGVASMYREVQGLSPSDTAYRRKKDLVAEIFRANLALQNRSDS
jgi:DNA anti-recombination protein RmuC